MLASTLIPLLASVSSVPPAPLDTLATGDAGSAVDALASVEPVDALAPFSPLDPALALLPDCGVGGFHGGSPFVHTLSGDSLRAGRWETSLRFDWNEYKTFSDADLIDFENRGVGTHSQERALAARLGLAYGLSDTFSFGVDLPYISNQELREVEPGTPQTVVDEGTANGFGDLSLIAKWRFWSNEASHVSAYFGAELPTGNDDVEDDDGQRFEAHHQPGSGSTDPFAGAAYTTQNDRLTFGTSLLYTFAGDGSQDSNLGDTLRANVAWGWRLSDARGRSTTNLLLECNGQWHERRTEGGVEDESSGGVQIFLSPGLHHQSESGWSWFASFGLPLAENLYGEQVSTTARASIGVGYGW